MKENRRPWRSSILLAAMLILASFNSRQGVDKIEPAGPPNIIIILIDALRPDHLSQYGYPFDTSPALNPLASHAFRFTRAYSPSSWTLPSVASLFSGLAPERHRSLVRGAKLHQDVITLAELLNEKGYRTAGFSSNVHISRKADLSQGFDYFWDYRGKELSYPDAVEILSKASAWLKKRETRRPFFLYLHLMNCHGPYTVPEDYEAALLGRPPQPDFEYYGEIMKAILYEGKLEIRQEVKPEFLISLKERYDTAIRYTTDKVGWFFEALRESNLYDGSLLILTSDHGEELFEHGGFSHGYSLYEDVLRIPLLIKMPGQKESAIVDLPVLLTDLYPTLLDMAGAKRRHSVDANTLLPLLLSGRGAGAASEKAEIRQIAADRPLFFQISYPGRCVAKAITWGDKKLIEVTSNYEGVKEARMLFNLAQDPGEKNNFAGRRVELVEVLGHILMEKIKEYRENMISEPGQFDDKDQAEWLRSLGYVR